MPSQRFKVFKGLEVVSVVNDLDWYYRNAVLTAALRA